MRKKVLILCRDFPPYFYSVGGVSRMIYLSKYLVENNVEPSVISAKGFFISNFGFEPILENIRRVYVKDIWQLVKTKRSLHSSLNNNKNLKAKTSLRSILIKLFAKIFGFLEKNILIDMGILSFATFFAAACAEINRGSRFIIVSVPPHSILLSSLMLKLVFRSKIHLALDYRDGWNTNTIFRSENPIGRYIELRLERSVLRYSDQVFFATEQMMNAVNSFAQISHKSSIILNGHPVEGEFNSEVIKKICATLNIGHFGYISDDQKSYRYIVPLLDMILSSNLPIELHLYGNVSFKKSTLEKYSFVKIYPNVNADEMYRTMRNMDLLLVYHYLSDGAQEAIPGKLYEHIAVNLPSLIIGPSNYAAHIFNEENEIGYAAAIEHEDQVQEVLKLANLDKIQQKEWDISKRLSKKYSRSKQYETILDSINQYYDK